MNITDIKPDPDTPILRIELNRKEALELLNTLRSKECGPRFLTLLLHLKSLWHDGKLE
jgi:hypothetical protein